jgi:hypothetical protein
MSQAAFQVAPFKRIASQGMQLSMSMMRTWRGIIYVHTLGLRNPLQVILASEYSVAVGYTVALNIQWQYGVA